MTREQLESLVWSEKHPDFRGENRETDEKEILYFLPAHGSCLVRLRDMTLGELLDALPSKHRARHGFLLWRVVLNAEGVLLGVFGYALRTDAELCTARARRAGGAARLLLWAGPRPKVGTVLDVAAQSLVTAESAQ